MNSKKVALVILDGYGIGKNDPKINAIVAAKTPFMDKINAENPHSTLLTFGENVGLPDGQMGNSEVGHMNIGAGRVVYQQLVLINKSFREHEVDKLPALLEAIEYSKNKNKNIHLLGLVSSGGVHSSMGHLKGLCSIFAQHDLKNVFVHAFTDGRDTDPMSGEGFIKDVEDHLAKTTGKIASVIGRYYAMDRDKRWERVKFAYDLLVHGNGEHFKSADAGLKASYANNITDEFIKPFIITDENNAPLATIQEGDVVLFFNFRTDRGRELTQALTQQDYPDFDMKKLSLYYITMTPYDKTYKNVKILFEEQDLQMTLGEVMEKNYKTQLRAAETEKYPHVTFFFSGGRETPFEGEKRILVPSAKVATYDLKPSMSARELCAAAVDEINTSTPDLVVLNFANPDMVGHTGVFKAVVEAIEVIDEVAEKLVTCCVSHDYAVIIIADHGNADFEVNPDGSPNTAHSMNPVPFIIIDKDHKWNVHDGKLADIAPTILKLMHLEKPVQMDGDVLIS